MAMGHLVAAPDKFRGTAQAGEVAEAMANAAREAGWTCEAVPMADGGEGTLEALGGPNRRSAVSGPLGQSVEAPWRLQGRLAVVEMAAASGLSLVGGPGGNRPLEATTRGTGELIRAAVAAGARQVIVGVGGSATTDGGWGAVEVLDGHLSGVELTVACDVETTFVSAAREFAGQKGAGPSQIALLERRLERLVQLYRQRFGIDVADLPGAGAAGGLAGGLAALGARLVPGFDLVADAAGLDEKLAGADLVATGEGFLDEHSFHGKVVGGMAELCRETGVPLLVVAGEVYPDAVPPALAASVEVVSLSARYGREQALEDPLALVSRVVLEWLRQQSPSG